MSGLGAQVVLAARRAERLKALAAELLDRLRSRPMSQSRRGKRL
ncbi:MAG TPA: hypothetical protein VID70_02020, partial [Solirubrobacteraceae bacterium]